MRANRFLLVAAAALLAGCGGQDSAETTLSLPPVPREVRVALDNYEGPESVGILMAQERGYFDDVAISADVTVALTPIRATQYAAEGSVDLAVTHQPQVVMDREEGEPIVVIGSLVSRPTAAMIWLPKSGIRGIADLKGKTIAIPDVSYAEGFLESVLARAGLTLDEVKLRRIRYQLAPPLRKGRVDAIFGGSWNLEGAALESRGLKPVIRHVQGLGIPDYDEAVLAGRADSLSERPDLFRDFISALRRGTAAAIEHPAAAVKAIEESGESNPYLSRSAVQAQLASTLPLLSRSGYSSPEQATDLVGWMDENGMIPRSLSASELLTNRYQEP